MTSILNNPRALLLLLFYTIAKTKNRYAEEPREAPSLCIFIHPQINSKAYMHGLLLFSLIVCHILQFLCFFPHIWLSAFPSLLSSGSSRSYETRGSPQLGFWYFGLYPTCLIFLSGIHNAYQKTVSNGL